jgi:hypothetical protein
VKQKSNTDYANGFTKKEQYPVDRHRRVRMQWVEIDTATIRLENRIRKQMVQINQHGGNEDEIYLFPVFSKASERNKKGKSNM